MPRLQRLHPNCTPFLHEPHYLGGNIWWTLELLGHCKSARLGNLTYRGVKVSICFYDSLIVKDNYTNYPGQEEVLGKVLG